MTAQPNTLGRHATKAWNGFQGACGVSGMRKVIDPLNPDLISAAWEAPSRTIQFNVQAAHKFEINGNSYSLSYISLFISSTIYILSSLDSYRWLSPIYTAIAARALIFHELDNLVIGLKGFVAVGLEEVSRCKITVEGQAEGREILGPFTLAAPPIILSSVRIPLCKSSLMVNRGRYRMSEEAFYTLELEWRGTKYSIASSRCLTMQESTV
ncbi:hypothetical protein PISMIDRAFT_8794 [Pisolithus microcarpus 441]|uniref:Uncharacterized protein n=1 Tax=Pisolithus microcarpus 441 TaxID=765257 RepID=A0A0C9ZX14_9AGAM|nr:hypothetical protein BKA83DRAFT_8794 [Pisolithus microcarpus]KIK26777.1 hypothetical protein PISMIDRAFT_8794 [Pisolithus microcarpus 441]